MSGKLIAPYCYCFGFFITSIYDWLILFIYRYFEKSHELYFLTDEIGEQVNHSKKSKNDKKNKPSLQIILDQAKSTDFSGDIILADDQLLVKIPPVTQ